MTNTRTPTAESPVTAERSDGPTAAPTGTPSPPRPALHGYRRVADIAYTALILLFVLGVLAQVLLAGLGVFSRGSGGPGFGPHVDLGNVLSIVTAVLLVLSVVAHVSWRVMVGSLVLEVLTEVVQHALAEEGWSHAWLGALHAFDGMLILLLAAGLAVTSVRRTTGVRIVRY